MYYYHNSIKLPLREHYGSTEEREEKPGKYIKEKKTVIKGTFSPSSCSMKVLSLRNRFAKETN